MRLHETEQRARAAELRVARAEAEREDAEALSVELREQLAQAERRAHTAETEVTRLRREALQWQDNKDELVEAKAELVLQAERIKTWDFPLIIYFTTVSLVFNVVYALISAIVDCVMGRELKGAVFLQPNNQCFQFGI